MTPIKQKKEIRENLTEKNDSGKNIFPRIVKTIVVEGNIGCGKSTFSQYLSKNPNVEIYPEPLQRWRNVNGNNLLQMFYSNPVQYAFPFQLYAALTMLETHKKTSLKPFKIMERSILSIKNCFIEDLKQSEIIEPVMADVLNEWISFVEKNSPINIDCIVYLRASPETLMKRIHKRNRPEEANLTIDQLYKMNVFYEKLIQNHRGCKIIEINAEIDESSIEIEYQKIEEELQFDETKNLL